MVKSKGKSSGLQHCWNFLEGHEKWKSRNCDGCPKPGKGNNSSSEMNDGEADDGDGDQRERVPRSPTLVSSIGWPCRRKRGNDKFMRKGEVEAMKKKNDEFIKTKNEYADKGKQEKMEIKEKKIQEKRAS